MRWDVMPMGARREGHRLKVRGEETYRHRLVQDRKWPRFQIVDILGWFFCHS